MKFGQLIKGTRAERPCEVPGYSMPDGKPFVVLLRPLTGLEYESACAQAIDRAKSKGVDNPQEGNAIYDLALMACVIAIGCVDPDSSPAARTPSFEGGHVQILDELQPELTVYLHEQHELWQRECSPHDLSFGDDLIAQVREVAGPNGHATFMRWSPNMRVNFAISTASQLLRSLEEKSGPGSGSGESPESSEKQPKKSSSEPEKTTAE